VLKSEAEDRMASMTATTGPVSDSRALSPVDFVLLAISAGLVTGAAEVSSYLFAWYALGRPFYRLGRNMFWTLPVADLLVFVVIGSLTALVMSRWRGDRLARGAFIAIVAVATYGVIPLGLRLHWLARILLSVGVGVQVGSFLYCHPQGLRRFVRIVVLPAICLVILIAFAFRANEVVAERRALAHLGPPPINAPNFVMIVLDAVRAEDLSVYGYGRSTTPNLERFAERSVVFNRAVATAPWTLASHATMFTGYYPHEMSAGWETALDDAYPTLAEKLRDRGYLTGAFFGNEIYGTPEFGLSRGFVHYKSRKLDLHGVLGASSLGWFLEGTINRLTHSKTRPGRRNAAEINQLLLNWLPKPGSRPFFAFLNYMDAHEPYDPPAPYDMKFSVKEPLRRINAGKRLTAVEIRGLREAYDGSIAYEDAQLGRLFRELQRRGEMSNTLVIVTADHGEEFGEHGWFSHGNGLYLPGLHVPLLISFPARIPGGVRVAEPVTLRDLPATVVDLLRFSDAAGMPGRSLSLRWEATSDSSRMAASPLLSEVNRPRNALSWYAVARGNMQSVIVGRHHYIRNGDGREELYDVAADPWEITNLAKAANSQQVIDVCRSALMSALSDPAGSAGVVRPH
jgi:arylsulfatase A-like enzyme